MKGRKPEGNRQCLRREELKKLEIMYAGFSIEDFSRVLHYFLFYCYTEIHFNDIKNLKNSKILFNNRHLFVSLRQLKTNLSVEIPLGSKAYTCLHEKG